MNNHFNHHFNSSSPPYNIFFGVFRFRIICLKTLVPAKVSSVLMCSLEQVILRLQHMFQRHNKKNFPHDNTKFPNLLIKCPMHKICCIDQLPCISRVMLFLTTISVRLTHNKKHIDGSEGKPKGGGFAIFLLPQRTAIN